VPSGRRRRPTALQTLATLVVAGISPAGATDVDPANLGAPCSADLDQRIADLEENYGAVDHTGDFQRHAAIAFARDRPAATSRVKANAVSRY
jgi:hypothetical protein